MLLSEKDIEYHYCGDPAKALAEAERLRPTVILQDLVMPQVDGMTLAKEFRQNPGTVDVPLIVLSAKEEPVVKAECFANGANDYLVKLPDKVELIARIRYHSAGYINLLERIRAHKALQASQKALAQELSEAADYVRALLPDPIKEGDIRSDWVFETSSSLGGDAFGYHWIDDEHFSIYLIDVCGHGVGAALLSISVINVIRSESLPSVNFKNPSEVMAGLNEAFPMESNHNMYFTMWYGIFHRPTRRLDFASGGHPPAILIGKENGTARELRTNGMMVGTIEGSDFASDSVEVPPRSSLYVFSDGTYELERPGGEMLDIDEFVEILAKLPPEKGTMEDLRRKMEQIQGCEGFEDDFSIMKLDL